MSEEIRLSGIGLRVTDDLLKQAKEQRRFTAACAAMSGLIASRMTAAEGNLIKRSLTYADALIEELNKPTEREV